MYNFICLIIELCGLISTSESCMNFSSIMKKNDFKVFPRYYNAAERKSLREYFESQASKKIEFNLVNCIVDDTENSNNFSKLRDCVFNVFEKFSTLMNSDFDEFYTSKKVDIQNSNVTVKNSKINVDADKIIYKHIMNFVQIEISYFMQRYLQEEKKILSNLEKKFNNASISVIPESTCKIIEYRSNIKIIILVSAIQDFIQKFTFYNDELKESLLLKYKKECAKNMKHYHYIDLNINVNDVEKVIVEDIVEFVFSYMQFKLIELGLKMTKFMNE